MFSGTNIIPQNISHVRLNMGILCGTMSISHDIPCVHTNIWEYFVEHCQSPHNNVMDMSNVMLASVCSFYMSATWVLSTR